MAEKLRLMTTVFLSRRNQILLLYRQGGSVVNNLWIGSAGGHFKNSDMNDAQTCVLRELKEELGISAEQLNGLALRYITIRRTESETRHNYYFFAELNESAPQTITSNEGRCNWFGHSAIHSLEMPFTAKYVIEHYLKEGINNKKIYGGIANGTELVFVELPAF